MTDQNDVEEPPKRRWRLTPTEARDEQLALRDRLIPHPPPGFAPALIGGADISLKRFGRTGYGGFVVLEAKTLTTRAESTATLPLDFPYIPGLLSFRELPVLQAAWESLAVKPDVVIFDGHGTAHPRRFGIACHGGVLLDVPTIGCAKTLLVGEHGRLGQRRWSTADIIHKDEVIGRAVRTRAGVAPIYVSAGHRMDLDTAVAIVRRTITRYREPETTRRTHRLVNELRRAMGD